MWQHVVLCKLSVVRSAPDCVDQVTLRSARCNDTDDLDRLIYKFTYLNSFQYRMCMNTASVVGCREECRLST